jgi:aldose 1-epimerase
MTMPRVTQRHYGVLTDGRAVDEFTLDNGRGLSLCAINFGGIVTALNVPGREGGAANVVLALPHLHDYETRNPNIGTLVGRYANRIAGGRFTLDGQAFELPRNNGANTLHGGPVGFGKRWWDIAPLPVGADGSVALELRLDSADGDQGFPGRIQVVVRYTLTTQQEWRIDYQATCDRATVVNLSHHAYFNLAGRGSVLAHRLQIAAARFCPVDAQLIPLGIAEVDGTPFDFRTPRPVGERIRQVHPQIIRAQGYDHNWVLDPPAGPGLRLAARLEEPASGRAMEVHTDQPGVQFYSGNFLDGTLAGANGHTLRQGDGLCLETQHFPDSPNQPAFPSTVLRPGEQYASTTVYRFGLCAP